MYIKKAETNGILYSYCGYPIRSEERSVIFFFGSGIGKEEENAVMLSAAEAFRSGYNVITNGFRKERKRLALLALECGGSLYHMEYKGLRNAYFRNEDRLEILSNGGIFSFLDDNEPYRPQNIARSNERIIHRAGQILFIGRAPGILVSNALDLGLDTAALRSSLHERSIREYANDGGLVIDTFSSWFQMPSAIAYFSENGSIGVLDYRCCANI